ncbi:hypothetical protein FV228_04925 [Methylobacterium sp. WL18]|nr:hypothetical protein FV228_04925 [Methylobacterium sp. WL18]
MRPRAASPAWAESGASRAARRRSGRIIGGTRQTVSRTVDARGVGPLSRAGEGQGEGCDLSGSTLSLTPTLSRTGEGARRGLHKQPLPARGEGFVAPLMSRGAKSQKPTSRKRSGRSPRRNRPRPAASRPASRPRPPGGRDTRRRR